MIYINISKNANTLMINIHISSWKHKTPEIYFLPKCSSTFPWMSLSLSIFSRVSPSIWVINIFKNGLINIIKKLLIYRWSIWLINIWNTPTRTGRGGGSHGDGQKSNSHNLMLILWYIWSWYPLDHHHWMFLCSKIIPSQMEV